MSSSLLILVLIIGVPITIAVLREVERLRLILDSVHALFNVVTGGRALDCRVVFFVSGKHLDLAREKALLRVRPELHLALASHRKAWLAGKTRVLIRLAHDELDDVPFARGDAGLVAV